MRFLLLPLVFLCACPAKQQQVRTGTVDKEGIQRRSDATHDDLKKEEQKSEERKENQ